MTCEGKVSDIKALESSTYWEFCRILNSYLEKVEIHNKQVEEMKNKFKRNDRKRASP